MRKGKMAAIVAVTIAFAGVLGFVGYGQSDGATVVVKPAAEIPFDKYAPKQPLDYSHKLHAGDLEIPCQYCHTFARRSPSAGIPALEQCVACHQIMARDKAPIQELVAKYDNKEPIEWVKVHDLPDFVFFSHKRHVQAGFECQDCHGPVQEMEVMYRQAPLTMGWCVNCHKQNLDKGASVDCVVCHK